MEENGDMGQWLKNGSERQKVDKVNFIVTKLHVGMKKHIEEKKWVVV